jgi:hypothetical protein
MEYSALVAAAAIIRPAAANSERSTGPQAVLNK